MLGNSEKGAGKQGKMNYSIDMRATAPTYKGGRPYICERPLNSDFLVPAIRMAGYEYQMPTASFTCIRVPAIHMAGMFSLAKKSFKSLQNQTNFYV